MKKNLISIKKMLKYTFWLLLFTQDIDSLQPQQLQSVKIDSFAVFFPLDWTFYWNTFSFMLLFSDVKLKRTSMVKKQKSNESFLVFPGF